MNREVNQLVEENMALVTHTIRKYFPEFINNTNIEYEDIFQVGCIALCKAAKRFDPTKNIQFSTYAVHTIRGELLKYRRDHMNSLRISRRLKELHGKIIYLENRGYTKKEIIKKLNITEEEYNETKIAFKSLISLDSIVNEDDEDKDLDLYSRIESEYNLEDHVLAKIELEQILDLLKQVLNCYEYKAIELLIFNQWSQEKIGEYLGVSQVQVSRINRQLRTVYLPAILDYLNGRPYRFNLLRRKLIKSEGQKMEKYREHINAIKKWAIENPNKSWVCSKILRDQGLEINNNRIYWVKQKAISELEKEGYTISNVGKNGKKTCLVKMEPQKIKEDIKKEENKINSNKEQVSLTNKLTIELNKEKLEVLHTALLGLIDLGTLSNKILEINLQYTFKDRSN